MSARPSRAARQALLLGIILGALLLIGNLQAVFAQSTQLPKAEIEKRVDALLVKMNLEEKLTLIGGINDFYIQALPRLGLPALRMSDGPLGVHDYGPTTAYPAGIALAASWDVDLARRVGEMMGKDARARGVHFILAPGMNIYRAPMNGRNFEYLGEDPYLASRLAVSLIEGMQSQGVIATAKHFAVNNQEYGRMDHSSDVDERTLREIYLPAFEAAVKEAKVGALMDAYNLVNGVYMFENHFLNNVIAKKEWGFDGIIMSDWGATHDGKAAANGGLDLEMPSALFMNKQTLLPAIQSGEIPITTIDDKVRRILRKAIQFGFYDREQTDRTIPLYSQQGRQLALEEASSGMVLLKNENGILPLEKNRIKTLAVLGPNAYPAVIGGGGSSLTKPFNSVSYLEGIKFLRFAQELDDFPQLLFGFINPSHVFERDLLLLHGEQAGTALAEAQSLVASSLHLADHYEPKDAEQKKGRKCDDGTGPVPACAFFERGLGVVSMVVERLEQVRVRGRHCQMIGTTIVVFSVRFVTHDGDVRNLAIIEQLPEFGITGFLVFGGISAALNHSPQDNAHREQGDPQNYRFECRIHLMTPKFLAREPSGPIRARWSSYKPAIYTKTLHNRKCSRPYF